VGGRGRLAKHVADELASAGFVAYGGGEYGQVYAAAQDRDGVFVDRHARDKRIFVLRRTSMPAVILETHNALHAVEALRWTEDETLEAMSAAIASALASALAEPRGLSAQRGRAVEPSQGGTTAPRRTCGVGGPTLVECVNATRKIAVCAQCARRNAVLGTNIVPRYNRSRSALPKGDR